MNILFLCDEYPPCQHGGIGSVTQQLARELAKKHHNVIVCGLYPFYRKAASYEEDKGVLVFRRYYGNKVILKLSKHKYFGRIINIKKRFYEYLDFVSGLIKKYEIEIIEIPDFNEVFYYSGPRFIRFPDFKIPSVIKLHGSYSFFDHINRSVSYNQSIFKKELTLITNATKVLSISEFSKQKVIEIFNYNKSISVIYNGLNLDSLSLKYEFISKIVVFAGTLAEKKGIISLVLAWGKVVMKIPEAKLFIYGKGGRTILTKINEMIPDKIKDSINIKGFIDKESLPEIYRTAACAIFPSYAESFSMAPLESMMVGCPTIYTNRASGAELITNGIDGILIDPDNIEDIARAVIYLLSNRTEAIKIGENGEKRIREKFNISAIADAHLELYSNLINEVE